MKKFCFIFAALLFCAGSAQLFAQLVLAPKLGSKSASKLPTSVLRERAFSKVQTLENGDIVVQYGEAGASVSTLGFIKHIYPEFNESEYAQVIRDYEMQVRRNSNRVNPIINTEKVSNDYLSRYGFRIEEVGFSKKGMADKIKEGRPFGLTFKADISAANFEARNLERKAAQDMREWAKKLEKNRVSGFKKFPKDASTVPWGMLLGHNPISDEFYIAYYASIKEKDPKTPKNTIYNQYSFKGWVHSAELASIVDRCEEVKF